MRKSPLAHQTPGSRETSWPGAEKMTKSALGGSHQVKHSTNQGENGTTEKVLCGLLLCLNSYTISKSIRIIPLPQKAATTRRQEWTCEARCWASGKQVGNKHTSNHGLSATHLEAQTMDTWLWLAHTTVSYYACIWSFFPLSNHELKIHFYRRGTIWENLEQIWLNVSLLH